jgi:hypothetical protein
MRKHTVVVDRHVDSVGRHGEHDYLSGGAAAAIDG